MVTFSNEGLEKESHSINRRNRKPDTHTLADIGFKIIS